MIKETYFFRDIENLESLEIKTKERLKNKKSQNKYEVLANIELTDKEFGYFSNNFKHNYKFLYKYIDLMKIDKEGIWKCVEVTGKGKRVLIQSNGYSYPRFTGLVL